MNGEWEDVVIETESIDWRGNPIVLRNVQAEKNKQTGKVRVDPVAMLRAEMEQLAEEHGLEGRDLALLLITYAPPGPFQPGYVHQKFRLNKMLFYLWKRLEEAGLGEALPHDEFVAGRAGPIPKHLKEDMRRLTKEGLLSVKWSEQPGESTISQLTDEGLELAKELWNHIPDDFTEVAHDVKEYLFPLNPTTIKERVHRDFPEFKRTYVEVDAE